MGLQSETFEENELFTSHLKTSDHESHLEASAMPPECLTNSVSMSSGYGTCSAAELSPSKYKDIQMCMEDPEEITKGKEGASPVPEGLVTASIQNTREYTQTGVEHCPLLKKMIKVFLMNLSIRSAKVIVEKQTVSLLAYICHSACN
uniref:Uncharacterized protein n=1 Tax=Podarcis muralis TaxID=64176 RepID=A0A670K8P3_PODMU